MRLSHLSKNVGKPACIVGQVETAFKALKTTGFNIEDTHLTDIDRIKKLFAFVMVAFVRAYKA